MPIVPFSPCPKSIITRRRTLLLGCLLAGCAMLLNACLDRPIGRGQPRTTNVLTDELVNTRVDKIDLLFVIDNSMSMGDKQKLLAEAVPDLVKGLVEPSCIARNGDNLGRPVAGACPPDSSPEFDPVEDIHVGVITSSLGGYGAVADCTDDGSLHAEQNVDMAHLLGSLPRGGEAAPSAASSGFLSWSPDTDRDQFFTEFQAMVTRAGERGCGWEAPLEAWLRFLVDPHPHTELVRGPCSATDTDNRCVGPKTDEAGNLIIDTGLLEQRKRFLRPDSLVAIVMLSDENDCSFKARGQSHTLAQTQNADKKAITALRPSAACDAPDMGPNSKCCQSCGVPNVPDGCPTTTDEQGETVAVGCESGKRYPLQGEDHPNLRCFEQKRRFGIDLLYPTERYSNALSLPRICPFADDLSTESDRCPGGEGVVDNPLFTDLSYDPAVGGATERIARSSNLVYLAGIVGVPWQDVAVSPDPKAPLVYRRAVSPEGSEQPGIEWDWLIGDPSSTDYAPTPADPLMIESVVPRTGVNPATGEPLAAADAHYRANSINGHEWNSEGQGDLQYACVFDLPESVDCKTTAELEAMGDAALNIPNCDCTDYGASDLRNPLCQGEDGSYGLTQTRAKAYPGLRQLRVLHDYGPNAIVASICPKSVDATTIDYGYRPAVAAIVERLKEQLFEKCYSRGLATRPDGSVACIVVEATPPNASPDATCSSPARNPISDGVAESVRKKLLSKGHCEDEASCAAMTLCEIDQIRADVDPEGLESCRNDSVPGGDGWCYIDEQREIGNPELLGKCPPTARRKVRYAGAGKPNVNTVTMVSCTGESFDE